MKNKFFIFFLSGILFPFVSLAKSGGVSNDSLQTFHRKMDSIYIELHQQQIKKDTQAILKSIEEIDKLVAPIENNFPLECGMVQLHQAYYTGNATASKPYFERAFINLKGVNSEFFLNYSGSFLWLIEGFYQENRQEEWAAADNLYRDILKGNEVYLPKYAISFAADKALTEKNYVLVKALARYDQFYFQELSGIEDKLHLVYLKWLQVKQNIEQWKNLPYTERSLTRFKFNQGQVIPSYLDSGKPDYSALRNYDYKTSLKNLLKELESLELDLVTNNKRSSGKFNEPLRRGYFNLYENLIQDLYVWGRNEHRQSEIILSSKKFLLEKISEELQDAAALKKVPVISSASLELQVNNLAQMYYDMGNAEQAHYTIIQGLELIKNSYTEDELVQALVRLRPMLIRIKRLSGDLESALDNNKLLKKLTPKPDSLTSANMHLFESFAEARVEEIYTIMAQGRREQAKDSLTFLLEEVESIKMEHEDLIYETKIWPHFQFITASVLAQIGNYNTIMITEMVTDLLNGQNTSEIFYPAQLFALKAKWHETGELDNDYFQNLLFYIERQLQQNFVFLTAEERMQLYAYRLNDIFDVFHQLLFEGKLDKHPEIKQKVISQSLYLKNALADGNLIPDEIFQRGNYNLDKKLLDELRVLKQETKLAQQVRKLQRIETKVNLLNDKIQTMWLELLEGGMDGLMNLGGVIAIKQKLNAGEVYLETVRYTRSLSDSSAVYGAYLISPENFTHLNICREQELLELLDMKNSSSQTVSLTSSAERGGIGISLKKKGVVDFQPGDKDLLGEILLRPLWPYLKDKSHLLMVHDGLLNRISFAALQWDQKFLMDHFRLRHFSGSESLGVRSPKPSSESEVLLAGGLDYGQEEKNLVRLFKPGIVWDYLPGTRSEIEILQPLFSEAGYQPQIWSGKQMSDSLSLDLGKFPFVHLATHGFYFDSSSADQFFDPYLSRQAMDLEPLFRSGLAISGANNPPIPTTLGTEGYLMGYEIANMDLRNCYLISLSACETGLGDLRNNLGVDGLPRALKIAGAKNLLISLWKVPDEPTAEFMRQFYSNLFIGKSLDGALQDTQRKMSKSYPASDWGAFILVE